MIERAEHRYDLFISHAAADRAWVEGYLLDALTQAGVRCHSEAAFALGVPRVLEFERAVQQSQRILLVLSPATLAEGYSQFTDLLAQFYGLETETWPVIPLLLQPVQLPPRLAMLTSLDATNPAQWPAVLRRLCAELQRPVPGPAPKPSCPYPGMVPFSEADSDRFFGRDQEIRDLLERLRLHPFLTIIGPSGSGKSSLVLAGLVPALRRSGLFGSGDWLVRALRPGETPLGALTSALEGDPTHPGRTVPALLAKHPNASHLLLVVDQFEELFTLARVDLESFQQALLDLTAVPDCYVVLTVRADFYANLMTTPLWGAIQAYRMEVLPLDEAGLRQAIARPAEDVGVFVEPALVERLVADAGQEPGSLPHVQETLALLWERLERHFLSLSAYEALGGTGRTGLQAAMACRADTVLAALTPDQQAIAHRICLRLVQFGEGRADTRRQQPVSALRAPSDQPVLFDQALRYLADHRLLTLGGEESHDRQVDIAHEALISGWPVFQEWLAERREAEQARRRLEAKAVEWVRLGRGSSGLLDQVELLEATRWLDSADAAELGYSEALPALVEASQAAQMEAVAQRRRATHFRLGALGAIAVLVMAMLVVIAVGLGQLAQQEEAAAATAHALAAAEAAARQTAEASAGEAQRQAHVATARQLAAQARSVLAEHPQRGLLLAVEALNISLRVGGPRVPEAESVLQEALANSGGCSILGGHDQGINAIAISLDGHWLATGSWDSTARLWDLTAADPAAAPIVLRDHGDSVTAVAFSPDGHWLATGSEDHSVRLWDLTATDPAAASIVLHGHKAGVTAVAFSPDGHWLATGSWDSTACLWGLNAADSITVTTDLHGHEAGVTAVTFSLDSRWLATGSGDHTARLWDLAAPDPTAAPLTLHDHEGTINVVSFSPDGHWLATGGEDRNARLWDLTASDPAATPITLHGHSFGVAAIAFSPDGHWLATGGRAYAARLWDLTAAAPAADPIILRSGGLDVTAVAFSPDSHWLVTGGKNTPCLWDLTAADLAAAYTILRGHEGYITTAVFTPDNHWLATGSYDNTARLWDLTAADPATTPIVLPGHRPQVSAAAISPDSRWLATGSQDGTAYLWDLTTVDPAADPIVLPGHESDIEAVAFSLDSRWLATGSQDNTARLWDLSAANPTTAYTVRHGGYRGSISAVAFSPDNHWLITAGRSTLRLWDLTAGDTAPASTFLRGHEKDVTAVAFSPNSRWLATGSWDNTARLWDLTAVDPAATSIVLSGHGDSGYPGITAIAISSDNHWLATGSTDKTARLWDLTASDPAADPIVLRGHEGGVTAVAFSPDGRWLVTGSGDDTARLWDLTTADPAADPIILHIHESSIAAVAFSPDNRWLATGSWDNTARLWNLTVADPATASTVLRGHKDHILTVAFSPDNRWLLTSSRDSTARLWNLQLEDLIALACRTAGRNLTVEEWQQYMGNVPHRKTCPELPLVTSGQ